MDGTGRADDGGLPLKGRRVLVLRSREQAEGLARAIESLGGEAVAYPVIRVADPEDWGPLDAAIRRIGEYQWLVITSPNGAARFADRLALPGLSPAALKGVQVVAVGAATARALGRRGIRVDLMPDQFLGRAIPAAMAEPVGDRVRPLRPGDRVLMARGDLANPGLAEELAERGALVDDRIAYRTLPAGGDAEALRQRLAAGEIAYVAFTSGSTVRNLLSQLGGPGGLGAARVACIGPETAAVAAELGLSVDCVGEPHTVEGLLQAIAADAARWPTPR